MLFPPQYRNGQEVPRATKIYYKIQAFIALGSYAVPAIGDFVVVGEMIAQYGVYVEMV